MKLSPSKFPVLFAVFIFFFLWSDKIVAQQKDAAWYISNAPFQMPEVIVPVFPGNRFSITDYGAVGDGQTLNTEAISKTIAACAAAGGGTVIVPKGLWLTGPVELKSNINLCVQRGALLQFTEDHSQYPIIKASSKSSSYVPASPIYGYDLKNIAITGEGIIDGEGESWRPLKKEKATASQWKDFTSSGGVVSDDGKIWWPSKEAMNGDQYLKELKKEKQKLTAENVLPARDFLRPYMVYLVGCDNILIKDVTIRNSPKFVFYANSCTNITMNRVNIFNEWWAQNGDGIDISRCKNVVIYDCTVSAGDDGICMKSSRSRKDDETANLQNIIIAKCVVYHAHGGFVIGSNTDGGMENIFVSDCNFIGSDIGIRVKSNVGRGGLVKNIYLKNIFMKDIVDEAISFNTYYEDKPAGKIQSDSKPVIKDKTPHFTDFYFDSIYCNGAKTAISITGLPERPVNDIYFKNMIITADKGFEATDAADLHLNNVKIISSKEPLFQLNSVKNITVANSGLTGDAAKYVQADAATSGVIFKN
jgi:DNA sulfur modification protein DndE